MTGKQKAMLIGFLIGPFGGFMLLLILIAAVMGANMSAQAGEAAQPGVVSSVAGIPPVLLSAYNNAVANLPKLRPNCTGMTWSLLAAIGEVESTQAAGSSIAANGDINPPIYGPVLDGSGVGGNTTAVYNTTDAEKQLDGGSTYARAMGPMQFMPATWISDGQDGNSDGARNPQNVFDAALTTATYLCGTGTTDLSKPDQVNAAILRYNHSQAYVDEVLKWKTTYDQMGQNAGNGSPVPGGSARGQAVVAAAQREMAANIPYSWGGGGTNGPSLGYCDGTNGYLNGSCSASHTVGFDCSGLAQYAYAQAGVNIARTAQDQYDGAPTKIPLSAGLAALQPGDLVFFSLNPGTGKGIYHVGIYIGGGQMINAAHTGTNVRSESVWMSSYTGGGRY
ncbi:NlpC/P60 family protein [Streptacidiphilus jiangxiensis]|uniref:Transglycosylase SLT domain-containing protein n=1 Tax=Streptacidiphilus jiangxiensis TaxID=235985 RepID=A0A1H8AR78_STRJI|nr:NlpC/P60 family protein [Streptacidiphilus jiangxiensis]SEM72309.1 Transglycosylase SLT domain-containing protein [Streptacidiphilus jiangxiensis]